MQQGGAHEHQPGALRSSIAWAVLGLVIERPGYGYELLQRYKRVYGATLSLSGPGRIYTALETLRMRSLIEDVGDEPAPANRLRLPRPRYRATERGVRTYQQWLLTQLEAARERGRLFARQVAMLEPNMALEMIDRYERAFLLESDPPAAPDTERQGVAGRLAEEDERLEFQVRLSWLEFARSQLKTLLERRADGEDLDA